MHSYEKLEMSENKKKIEANNTNIKNAEQKKTTGGQGDTMENT